MTRRPTRKIRATNTPSVPKVSASAPTRFARLKSVWPSPLFSDAASGGSKTNARTVAMSCTIDQPTAM
jgi:hypothetical protein